MSYAEVYDHLAAHVDRYTRGDPLALTDGLTRYSAKERLASLFDSVLREEEWIESITRYSYFHANGFAKLVLASSNELQLRLHIWRPANPPLTVSENVHSHRWDFSSLMIHGGYRYQEFVAAPGGVTFFAYGYESRRGVTSYSLTPTGRRVLACSFDAYLPAGSSYTLSGDVLHRVVSDPTMTTATLVLQGPATRDSVHVLSEKPIDVGATARPVQFSPEEISSYIGDLARRLDLG